MFTSNSTILSSVAGEDNQLAAGALGIAAILTTTAVYFTLRSKGKENGFPKLRGIQLYHAWDFFYRRYDFLLSNFNRSSGKSFSFNVLHHNVIALAGEDARRVLFTTPHFDLSEGIKLLLGIAPQIENVNDIELDPDAKGDTIPHFNRKLNRLFSHNRLEDVLPTLLQDIIDQAGKWGNGGKSGRIDPFIEVYELIFVLTARMTTCEELTKDEADLKRILELFSTLHTSSTPAAVLLPWFPSPARKKTREATTELFTILCTYVEARRKAEPTSEAMDVLIAEGESTQSIADYIMKVLFAGVINTGVVTCWALVYLAVHSEWREKCKQEIQDLISRHSDSPPSSTLGEKLGAVPISGWQNELPMLDACLQETHRICLTPMAFRRNLGKEIDIGGQVVKRGDFVVYPIAEFHLNPEFYPEPYKFDPSRWLRPDPVPNATHKFLGWGSGRHACTGMKVAKLEMKMILAVFLEKYDYELVDGDGKRVSQMPVPNRNDLNQTGPLGPTCYLDFKQASTD